MADAGKTRISIFNKIKTKINSSPSDPNLPELTGMMLQNRILVGQKMNTDLATYLPLNDQKNL